MSTSSVLSFDPNTLLSFYQAKLSQSLVSSTAQAASQAAPTNNATASDAPPWKNATTPAQEVQDSKVLGITNFMDLSSVPILSGSTTDTKTEQDNQKLFALYTAVSNLSYLAGMSQRDGATAGQLQGYNTRFQTGLQQVESYIGTASFNNFTLQAASPSPSVTSTAQVPLAQFGYTGSTIVNDASIGNALPGVSASDSFTVSVTKGGTTTNVPIDLSQVQGPLTLDAIVSYANQQLAAAGFTTRFKRVFTEGSINDVKNASYGIQLNSVASEKVSLSSAAATPSLYVAGTSGSATTVGDTAANIQGRLVKLSDLSNPQGSFSVTADPSKGTSTAASTVVDGDGNVYTVGNTTGSFGNQLNQGSQDVYLSKYDSAGNLQWTQLVGSAGSASAYSLALNPTGGVVLAGSTNADLVQGAVANGNTDSFVAKYDAGGNQTWVKQIQTLNENQPASVSVDGSGNVYVGGQTKGAIGAGQTSAGGTDAYVVKLDSTGKTVYEQQFGTSGSDTVAATAVTASGDLMVASVQNGEAILSKYTGGDATQAPAWQIDLGALQSGGTIGGIAVSGNQVYVSGTTQNAALNAGGAASVAGPASGGLDAFVFGATDNGAAATSNFVSYVGTNGTDKAGAVTVGSDGTIYLAGTTTGTFAGQTRSVDGTNNMFVAALSSTGTTDWVRQYGGALGQSTGQGIAFDNQGASVLDALGLPRGTVAPNQSLKLTTQTTLRAGDSFQMEIDGTAARTFTVTIAQNETLQSLVTKINAELGDKGKASINFTSSGEGLRIQVSSGVTAKLIAGPKDFDALGRLGISPGTLSDGSSTTSTSTTTDSKQAYGLGLIPNLSIATTSGAASAKAQLRAVLSAIKNTYSATNTPASSSTTNTQSGATASAYTQARLANYTLGLSLMSSSTSSTTSSTSGLFG
jgi:hypothetical protein